LGRDWQVRWRVEVQWQLLGLEGKQGEDERLVVELYPDCVDILRFFVGRSHDKNWRQALSVIAQLPLSSDCSPVANPQRTQPTD
jgi:hypothetical protein